VQARLDHAYETFAFIGRLEGVRSADEILDHLAKALGRFGFETFMFAGLPDPAQLTAYYVLANNWPRGWSDLYAEQDYVTVDPVARLCRRSASPFAWSEAPYDRETEPRAHEVMKRARDFRMANGFCIPIHGLTGHGACVSFGGLDIDLSPRTRSALHLMGVYAFERICQLVRPPASPRLVVITTREREVLTWTALGKTSSEVAEILGLTKRTVDEYALRASRKLRAQNKTHAVVKALQQGLISTEL
jgi:LuxR family quorum sensing-dependent transcriptional regulator